MTDRVLEYLMGGLGPDERLQLEMESVHNPELRAELDSFREVLEVQAMEGAVAPPARSKASFLAEIDRISQAPDSDPPVLNPSSTAEDYRPWLEMEGMVPPEDYENLFFIPICENEDGLSAIVWIKGEVEEEVHHDCIERFLVLEGSCNISFAGETYSLKEGDVLGVPLHTPHTVKVTSEQPCKLIVQRNAA